MKVSKAPVLLTVALGLGLTIAAEKKPTPREQTKFSAEDEGVERPIPLPDGVTQLLEREERVRDTVKDSDSPVEKPPASWFAASRIHLAGAGEEDIIVVAEGELRGANVTTFWALRPTKDGYEIVLAGPAHDLIVKRSRWLGYREIELFSATASECSTVTLRFDGKKYSVYRDHSGPIPDCRSIR